MSLMNKYWITPDGVFLISGTEHANFATAVMLNLPKDRRVPNSWSIRGVPANEQEEALVRGADPKAVKWLSEKKDSRLFACKEYGWIRVAKNDFNAWVFDDFAADLIRDSKEYWSDQPGMNAHEMINITELKSGDRYDIRAKALLDGGKPSVLKNLAMGRTGVDESIESVRPVYSTAKFSELEIQRLQRRTGDNPPWHILIRDGKSHLEFLDADQKIIDEIEDRLGLSTGLLSGAIELDNWFVPKELRGRGIGKKIYEKGMNMAKKEKRPIIILNAFENEKEMAKFHRRHGFSGSDEYLYWIPYR